MRVGTAGLGTTMANPQINHTPGARQ